MPQLLQTLRIPLRLNRNRSRRSLCRSWNTAGTLFSGAFCWARKRRSKALQRSLARHFCNRDSKVLASSLRPVGRFLRDDHSDGGGGADGGGGGGSLSGATSLSADFEFWSGSLASRAASRALIPMMVIRGFRGGVDFGVTCGLVVAVVV